MRFYVLFMWKVKYESEKKHTKLREKTANTRKKKETMKREENV